MKISVSGKAIVGGEVGISNNSVSLSVGLGFGASINVGSMSVDFSLSLTDFEADKVNNMTDVVLEPWGVNKFGCQKIIMNP